MTTPSDAPGGAASPLPRTPQEWRVRLDEEEFRVLREGGTERPFTGAFVHHSAAGRYACRGCGRELFASAAKFDSGCGWPSFDRAVPETVRLLEDRSHGTVRTECRCAHCDSHLGHVFHGEGLTPENTRYCINSVSLTFHPAPDTP
ncbi:peptide-methionine (R)-S-oxide reductase [Pilimelia terevasa]|uniref:peptide-methionine (R)-S-oxide reductase n=1 Tax=Pilimelia terevasa TaxID=53372 RepID=A0A8J3BTE2_9ACTN|nr:peptide-methionine (R)-S-oxide reductase MsrB [Pilimelia terevasa]GGK39340.1 peptide-methionine (R)-S-oxide reductase [Pilimelia terevasa]